MLNFQKRHYERSLYPRGPDYKEAMIFLDILDIPDIQGGGREGARERRARREGGRGKRGETEEKEQKQEGKGQETRKEGRERGKKGKTSLKMIILEGKLSQNRVREGIWEGGREFGCLSRRRRPKKKHHCTKGTFQQRGEAGNEV